MRHSYTAIALSAALVFVSGVAVGQRVQESPFTRYRTAATPSQLDIMLIHADLSELRDQVGYNALGFAPARFFFDEHPDRITAFVKVDGRVLAKQSSANVRILLVAVAKSEYEHFLVSMPWLSEDQFEADFKDMAGGGPVNFAEYKNGQLNLH